MGQMVKWQNKLVRINPNDSTQLQFTTDNGINWFMMGVGHLNGGKIQDLMDNNDELWATTSNGLFCTKDGGVNWSKK